MNPVIKFTTLFGLWRWSLAITLTPGWAHTLAAVFFLISTVFVWRSFYGMRITEKEVSQLPLRAAPLPPPSPTEEAGQVLPIRLFDACLIPHFRKINGAGSCDK